MIAACKMPAPTSTAFVPPPPKIVEAPEVIPLKKSQTPDDIKLVSAALIERLRGGIVAVENVSFDLNGRYAFGETGFNYDDFDVHNLAITGYVTTLLEPGVAQALLEGIILFKDSINRRAGVYFAAQYVVTQKNITINKAVVAGIPPDFPRVETYFIPEKPFKAAAANLKNYVDYYLFAIENAEPMTYGPGEKKTGTNQKYFIMTFCKDRLFQESSLEMKVTSKPNMGGKKLADPVYINDSGWRIIIAGGKFRPGSASSKFYVGISYKQDPSSHLPSVVVGEFHNVKKEAGTGQQAVASQAASAAQAAASQSAEGPLAAGKAFLNPVFPEDVEVIQIRLKNLGLYKAKIDRDFGPLTKKALDSFAIKNGFPKGQWSLDLQKALFKGTGL